MIGGSACFSIPTTSPSFDTTTTAPKKDKDNVNKNIFTNIFDDGWSTKYGQFSSREMANAKEAARDMFYFGYDNYMKYAFPLDEVCSNDN